MARSCSLANRRSCCASGLHPDLPSLRAGRENDRVPETVRLIANNTHQIKHLENRHPAPSGNVLREAGRPLRERAGRESLGMTHRRLCNFASISLSYSHFALLTSTRDSCTRPPGLIAIHSCPVQGFVTIGARRCEGRNHLHSSWPDLIHGCRFTCSLPPHGSTAEECTTSDTPCPG